MRVARERYISGLALAATWVMLGTGCGDGGDDGGDDDGDDGGGGSALDASTPAPDGPGEEPDAGDDPGTACDDLFSSAIFCSGFERPGLADEELVAFENGGTVAIAHYAPWQGAGALRAEITNREGASSSAAVAIARPLLPQTGSVYMRAYIRPSEVMMDGAIILMQLQRNSGSTPSLALYMKPDSTLFTYSSISGPKDEDGEPHPLFTGEWACIEMHVELSDAPNGLIQILLNGALIIESSGIVTRSEEGDYTDAQVGIAFAGPKAVRAAVDVDEFVVSATPIGCSE